MFWRNDFEALNRAYGRFVTIEIDSTSGVSTLQVKAYRPEDAQRVADSLLRFSEQLVNTLNERARHDALAVFQTEVESIEQRIATIQDQLTAYRVKEKMLDPKSAATGPIELLAQMNGQLANAKAQLAEVMKNSPNSPQIPLVRTRIGSLEKLIAEERAKITGDSNSVATALGEYERLDRAAPAGRKTARFRLRLAGSGPPRSAAPAALSRNHRQAEPGGLPALSEADRLVRNGCRDLRAGLWHRLALDRQRPRARLGLTGRGGSGPLAMANTP